MAKSSSTVATIEWEGERLTFDIKDIRVSQAVVMTQHAGRPVTQILTDFLRMDPVAAQSVLWWILSSNGKPADPATLDFNMVELLEKFNEAIPEPEKKPAPKARTAPTKRA